MANDIKAQLNAYEKRVNKIIDDIVKQTFTNEFKVELAERAIKLIKARTRSGQGVNDDNAESQSIKIVPLPPLSEKYKEVRKQIELGKFGKVNRSNLTLTGSMLEDLTYTLLAEGVRIYLGDSPRDAVAYRRKDGTVSLHQSSSTNNEIASSLSARGFKFLALSKDEAKILTELVNRRLLATARKLARG